MPNQHFEVSLFAEANLPKTHIRSNQESHRPVRATINKEQSRRSRKNGTTNKGVTDASKIIKKFSLNLIQFF